MTASSVAVSSRGRAVALAAAAVVAAALATTVAALTALAFGADPAFGTSSRLAQLGRIYFSSITV